VSPNSPAEVAGLVPKQDYIVASKTFMFKDIDSIGINSKVGKPMHISVYNIHSQIMRETTIVPSKSWGGKGLLGCKLSMGDEYTIPVSKSMKQSKESTLKSLFGKASLSKSKSAYDVRRIAWKGKEESKDDVELSAIGLNRGENSDLEDPQCSQMGLNEEEQFSPLYSIRQNENSQLDMEGIEVDVNNIKEDEDEEVGDFFLEKDEEESKMNAPKTRFTMTLKRPTTVAIAGNTISENPCDLDRI